MHWYIQTQVLGKSASIELQTKIKYVLNYFTYTNVHSMCIKLIAIAANNKTQTKAKSNLKFKTI